MSLVFTAAAYLKLSGHQQLKNIYLSAVKKQNGGYVRNTTNEAIGRLVWLLFEILQLVLLGFPLPIWLETEAWKGNERARYVGLAWMLLAWYGIVFGQDRSDGTPGFAVYCMRMVEWADQRISSAGEEQRLSNTASGDGG